jgi:hypothetical protein
MTYLEADIPDLGLLEKIKAGQMPTAKEIFSSEMLPFVIAAIAIPVALVLASKLKKRRKKTVPRP